MKLAKRRYPRYAMVCHLNVYVRDDASKAISRFIRKWCGVK